MAMTNWLPRTMTGLVTVACVSASVPLLIGLIWAESELSQFKTRAERITNDGLVVNQVGNELREHLRSSERTLRQYAILSDESLLPSVKVHLENAQTELIRLDTLSSSDALALPAGAARRNLQRLAELGQTPLEEDQVQLIIEAIDSMRTVTQALIELGRQQTIKELRGLKADAVAAQRAIVIAIVALLPLTALLAHGFSLAITRPLRKMNRGLAELGYGRYKRPIVIQYPQEMQNLGSRLDWLRQRLSMLELNKDRFLRHVSHELKTPLASLEEGSALLLEERLGELSPRQAEVVRIISEATSELGKLIDNLLAYAEWRRGERQIEWVWFDAVRLIDDVCDAYRLPMERKDITFTLQIEVEQLHGQRARLKTALENLLSNAVKYAPSRSSIEVSVGVLCKHFVLSVRDHGPGVSELDVKRIFEPFFRGVRAQESDIRGTGVGLSIVLETVKAHGGTVDVEDANPGARFTMKWPNDSNDTS